MMSIDHDKGSYRNNDLPRSTLYGGIKKRKSFKNHAHYDNEKQLTAVILFGYGEDKLDCNMVRISSNEIGIFSITIPLENISFV